MIAYSMFFLIFGILLGIDLASKYIAAHFLSEKIYILFQLVYLEYVKNPGIAFSFPLEGVLLKLVTLCLIFGIIYYYVSVERQKKNILVDLSFVCILAGAFGNGVERIFLGEVTDFIGISYFAIFNLADSFISIGALLYGLHVLKQKNIS